MNKKQYLDFLYYKIGKQQYDFRINGLWKNKEGKICSTKWIKYSVLCFPLESWENNKIQIFNNREILPCEVVIDLEEKALTNNVILKLKDDDLKFYIFDTHSRGVHIHIFFNQPLTNDEKLGIIKRYSGDINKAYNGTSIALEGAKHWKSGRIKEMIYDGL